MIFYKLHEEHFTFHLQYKHSGTFANRKYEDWTVLPQKSENVRPHYSQSSRANATPSSGTSSLASYKEIPPDPIRRESRSRKLPLVKMNIDL